MRLSFLSKSRGIRNLAWRIGSVLTHFDFSGEKFEKLLEKYCEKTSQADCLPTFAITAVIMARHPKQIKALSDKGVEFAVHGYVHIDYKVLPLEEKINHFRKAIEAFNENDIPFVGFRAPFLRVSDQTTPVLSQLGFKYHSSRVLHWPVLDMNKFSRYARSNHDKLLEFCAPLDSDDYFSLPRFESGLVEIPVSIPDDETLVERLGVRDQQTIRDIWLNIMQQTYDRGELFILSLHPERIDFCASALTDVLKKARELSPAVWVATLKEIAEWWQERANFSFNVLPAGQGLYRVHAECSKRGSVLIKNVMVNAPKTGWSDGYSIIDLRDFVLESSNRPVIGVKRGSSPDAVKFLKHEGYVVEESDSADDYGIYLDNLEKFDEADEKPLSRRVESSGAPLVKFWRWPGKFQSAFSVTGDIDSITITDFVLRVFENWRRVPRMKTIITDAKNCEVGTAEKLSGSYKQSPDA